jgi:hypothetical protein
MEKDLFIYNGEVCEGENAAKYRRRVKAKQAIDDLNKRYPPVVLKTLSVKEDDIMEQNEEQTTSNNQLNIISDAYSQQTQSSNAHQVSEQSSDRQLPHNTDQRALLSNEQGVPQTKRTSQVRHKISC